MNVRKRFNAFTKNFKLDYEKTMTKSIIFIFTKESQGKALSFEQAQEQEEDLIVDNWTHTSTINAKIFIERLINMTDHVSIAREVMELTELK